jgi:hypothetical protein
MIEHWAATFVALLGARREPPRVRSSAFRYLRTPTENAIRYQADMAILLQQDLANIEAGLYPLPADHDGSLLTLLHRSRLFFEDLPEIHRRHESQFCELHHDECCAAFLLNEHFCKSMFSS